MRHSICVVTGTRADYGLLRPLLLLLRSSPAVELRLVATGSHLSRAFGGTLDEVQADGFPIHAEIPLPIDGDRRQDIAHATGVAISAFTHYFSENRPDLLVVLGDRYEIFAASSSAALLGIPIAHISGGDTTEGAIDEFLRHSITKMSILHFTGCEDSRRRVIQLGEAPDRVFNVGEPGVENAATLAKLTPEELGADLGFPLAGHPYAVVTFHPVTMENGSGEVQVKALIEAMDAVSELRYIVTLANADAGGRSINQIWKQAGARRQNWLVRPSLGVKRYLSALCHASLVLGNSSSGIVEAPFFHTPTVNIGDRQKGRTMAESVLCCQPVASDIEAAMRRALQPQFRAIAAKAASPFGDGHTAEKIMPVLLAFLENPDRTVKKTFYDISFGGMTP